MSFAAAVLLVQASSYFPPPATQPLVRCGNRIKPYHPIDHFTESWFSSQLRAAGEPSLFAQRTRFPALRRRSVRFTWLRTFDHPVIIRVDWTDGARPWLRATELSGAGGYSPGTVQRRIIRKLTGDERVALRDALRAAQFGAAPMALCDMGCDGAEWLFETIGRKGYKVALRWSSESGPFRALGLTLMRMTGWRMSPVY